MKNQEAQSPSHLSSAMDVEVPSPSCNKTLAPEICNPAHGNPNSMETEKEQTPSPLNSTDAMEVEAPTESCNKTLTQVPNPNQGNPNSRDMERAGAPSSSNSVGNVDFEERDEAEVLTVRNSSEIPCFLRKVFDAEIENLTGGSHDLLLVLAVHAVFLESGFTAFIPAKSAKSAAVAGGRLPKQWASSAGPVFCIRYTLPSLVNSACNSSVETVILKFQILGRFVSVYGCLDSKGSELRRISMDTSLFVPCIDYVYRAYEEDGDLERTQERVLFEFWKIVKDGLLTPLLIALCSKTGFPPPSCFMVLPTDLKLWILESIPGVDVAKVACVCSELKYLSSNDALWKKKFEEEFGARGVEGGVQVGCWKEKFVLHWKRKRMASNEKPRSLAPYVHIRRGRPRYGAPQGFGMIGGDYDGTLIPFGPRRLRRNFLPNCNCGPYHVLFST